MKINLFMGYWLNQNINALVSFTHVRCFEGTSIDFVFDGLEVFHSHKSEGWC